MTRTITIVVLVVALVLAILNGPALAGYHHGGVGEALLGEHCIVWHLTGEVWCR